MTQTDIDFFDNLLGGLDVGFGRAYNIFCCEEAVKIANILRTKDRILEYHKASTELQKVMVTDVNYNDHSGNTLSMSCHIAIKYLPIMIRDDKINDILD